MRDLKRSGINIGGALLLLATTLLVATGPISATTLVDGSLDTTFSDDGKTTTDFGGRDEASSLAVQPDGKIIVAGAAEGEVSGYISDDFAVARYNTDGSLDTTFDSDGKTTTNFRVTSSNEAYNDGAYSVAVQPDGKIIVAGYSSDADMLDVDFALARYNTDGSLDTTFDSDGKTTTNFGGRDRATSVAVQSDGKIIAVGFFKSDSEETEDAFAIARYNTDGSLDTTFDSDGKTTTNFGDNSSDYATSVALQQDGKIIVAGKTNPFQTVDFALARYNANGSLDTTFDSDGKATTNFGVYVEANSVALQPDGKIIVAGHTNAHPTSDFLLARYNANGSLDTTFDSDGKTTTNLGGDDRVGSVALQPDGKIIVAGGSDALGTVDFAVARYNANGSLDTSFDGDGKISTSFGSGWDLAFSVAVQSDGRIVAGGASRSSADFAVVRYHAAPLTVSLATASATSTSANLTFTVNGTKDIDCTTISRTAGVDFNLTGISAITEITQTSPTVCTITALSSATPGGETVTATLAAALSFSIGDANSNKRTTINNASQSVQVTLAAIPPTTTTTTSTSTTSSALSQSTINALPEASPTLVEDSFLTPGRSIVVKSGGFAPGEFVQLVVASTPRVIGSGYASSKGVVSLKGKLPRDLGVGKHNLAVYAPGSKKGFRQTFTVTRAELPATGSTKQPQNLMAALSLAALGASLLFTRRRLVN